jgi:hypothetical protein
MTLADYANTRTLWLGHKNPTGNRFYGLIDDVKIYDRALTPDEISWLYKENVYSDCNDVQDANYGLLSDLNGDCYVNSEDLKIVADYWLNLDCGSSNHCEGADFEPTNDTVDFVDFSKFGLQWMQCNDPQTPGS